MKTRFIFSPRNIVTISPEAWLRMSPAARRAKYKYKSVRFVPPKLGDRDFGRFEVELPLTEILLNGRKK